MYVCMDGCMAVCMNGWMYGCGCMDACMDVWMYGWMYGRMDGWVCGWMDGCGDVWMNGCIYIYIYIYIFVCFFKASNTTARPMFERKSKSTIKAPFKTRTNISRQLVTINKPFAVDCAR